MKLNELSPAPGARKVRFRVGRGLGSGNGKTSGKGQKGQKSRSGGGVRTGFEGGQMPLQRRVPKFGFKNINHKEYLAINLSVLQELAEAKNLTVISPVELREAGYSKAKGLVKILGNGELKAKLEVKAHAFSKTAKEAIEAVGGITTII